MLRICGFPSPAGSGAYPSAELRDGTRDSVLALKIHAVLHAGSPARSALFEYFAYFVVSKIYAGSALHALQMRWLFVGAALVLRKARRISLCS